jgi:hypothetical protein
MKKLLLISFISLSELLSFAQVNEIIIQLDTTTYFSESNDLTWFKGTLKDTIFYCKKIKIDSIICDKTSNICDTIFFIQYFDSGWRYLNDTLINQDFNNIKCGYLYKKEKVGLWSYTDKSSCFTEGTLISYVSYYYHDECIPRNFYDKYFYLNDSLSGFIDTEYSSLKTITDNLYFSCTKRNEGDYNCSISLNKGQLITNVPLKYLEDEVNLILSGYYNRDIYNKK